jgi:hypothetical protein
MAEGLYGRILRCARRYDKQGRPLCQGLNAGGTCCKRLASAADPEGVGWYCARHLALIKLEARKLARRLARPAAPRRTDRVAKAAPAREPIVAKLMQQHGLTEAQAELVAAHHYASQLGGAQEPEP